MRLLDKEQINNDKAKERKREVDEGVKLAKQIDELRQLKATEEKNLTTFREATLNSLREETEQASKTLEGLKQEHVQLQRKNDILRMPLDAEWEKLNHEKMLFDEFHRGVLEREAKLLANRQLYEREQRELEIEKGRIADIKRRTVEDFKEAEATLEQARTESTDLRHRAQLIEESARLREKILTDSEKRIALKEQELDNREKRALDYEDRLFKKELELKDRWKVLLETEQNG